MYTIKRIQKYNDKNWQAKYRCNGLLVLSAQNRGKKNSLTSATANGLDLEDDNVLSVDEARTAITAIDHAIDEVNRERS